MAAAQALQAQGLTAHVVSVTSWSELARDGMRAESDGTEPFVRALLACTRGPIVAASDYVRAVPEAIRAYLPPGRGYRTLGTDGFGRSDTRAMLREHFGVDAAHIAEAARQALRASSGEGL